MVVWLRSVRKFRHCSRNELPNKQAWTRVNSGASSGTVTRILTAAILIPAVVALVWWGPTWLVAAAGGSVALLALFEFFSLGARLNLRAYQLWTCICAMGIFFQQWTASAAETSVNSPRRFPDGVLHHRAHARNLPSPLDLVFFIFLLGCAATVFASRRPLVDALGDIGISTAGLVFIALPLSAVVRIHGVGHTRPEASAVYPGAGLGGRHGWPIL